MQSQSYSSFYMRMRQTYAPGAHQQEHHANDDSPQHQQQQQQQQQQRRSDVMDASPETAYAPPSLWSRGASSVEKSRPLSEVVAPPPPPPSFRARQSEGRYDVGALAEIQQKLAAIQNRGSPAQYEVPQQRPHPHPQPQQQQQQSKQHEQIVPYSPSAAQPGVDYKPVGGCGAPVERRVSPYSPVISSPSSRSSKHEELHDKFTTKNVPPTPAAGCGGEADDEVLTPQELTFLRVVEFAVPVAVYAQLEPTAGIVAVCEQAIAKLFPQHLVLIRPDGVAAVELVIEELCELNEDEKICALDCVVQAKGTTRRQLIRVVCPDSIARGTLFKLVCARRTQLENAKRQQKNGHAP
ncbi:putative antigenic protein [Trypanosoma grayi]|uniref:putative antigenic protein n=1 Tax=Trypanosoma grayi TaxID=71804 RepID=UPI0004F4891E|nr:putative antigenic protein [Trypanosoma grayi]KEG13717.1 putative antigenic protein [Trypanosoma grayi]